MNAVVDLPPAPPRGVVWAAGVSIAAALLGFVPVHLIWALGVPLFADEARFDAWYADGGGGYLVALTVLALLPALLALAQVRPWGLTWAGRRVPRLLLIVPGVVVSAVLLAYTVFAAVLLPLQWSDPAGIFSPWTVVYGIAQFLLWAGGLIVSTRSYARRTASR